MFRVICTSQQEKIQWMEASETISKIKDLDQNHPVMRFLTRLYKEPGSVEVADRMIIPTESRTPRGQKGNFRPGASGYRERI